MHFYLKILIVKMAQSLFAEIQEIQYCESLRNGPSTWCNTAHNTVNRTSCLLQYMCDIFHPKYC